MEHNATNSLELAFITLKWKLFLRLLLKMLISLEEVKMKIVQMKMKIAEILF